ncbi:thiamine phosphate synthase [Agathobacter sp.]
MDRSALKLYAITDRQWLRGAKLSDHVRLALEGGATMIQIRDKDILSHAGSKNTDTDNIDDTQLCGCEHKTTEMTVQAEKKEALEIRRICHEYNAPLIINDNVQFALDIDADGVHLGQDDMDPAEARKLLGSDKIIGVTAKTIEQAKTAESKGADYLGSGAVFGSTTKLDAKPMTKELLKEITASVDIPVVAIGGINADNAGELKGTGIAGIAVVGGIFASDDIKQAARELAHICDAL